MNKHQRRCLMIPLNTIDAEDYLLGPEKSWERASIAPLYWKNSTGFVITGKGAGRTVRNTDGDWKSSAKGLKVIYGTILDDGRVTMESSNLTGSGDSDALRMLDVTGFFGGGAVTASKTEDDYLTLGYWASQDDVAEYRFP